MTDLRVLILTGAGRAFCAGQDLAERAAQVATDDGRGQVDLRDSLEENFNPLVRRLAALPCPVIAAVNGIASGAGAGLAATCDLIVAGRSARLQFPFARVGLSPDTGVSWTLQRRIGFSRAMGALLLGETINAETARNWGLVWQLFEDEELDAAALALANELAERSAPVLASTKQPLRAAAGLTLDDALVAERDAQARHGAPHYRDQSPPSPPSAHRASLSPPCTYQERNAP